MKTVIALISVLAGALSLAAQTAVEATLNNPAACATRDNLVAETSAGFPRTEFYSCDGKNLSAVIEYGRKGPSSDPEKFGFAANKEDTEALRKAFPKQEFLCPADKAGKKYLEEFLRLVRRRDSLRK